MPSPVVLYSALYSSTHSKRGKATGDKICEHAFKVTSRGDQWMKIHKFGCVSHCYYLIGDVWRTLWTLICELSPAQKKSHYFSRFRGEPQESESGLKNPLRGRHRMNPSFKTRYRTCNKSLSSREGEFVEPILIYFITLRHALIRYRGRRCGQI